MDTKGRKTMMNSNTRNHNGIAIALFDVDGTLLKGSSSVAGTWFLFRLGMLGPRYLFIGIWYAVLHGLGLATYERIYERGLAVFRGMSVDELLVLSRRCLEKHIQRRFYVGALQELQAHLEFGRKVVLVSAGPRYLISMIGEHLGVADCITAGPLLENGRVTDVLDGPLCSGQGKVQRVTQYLAEHKITPEQCVYYGDSINDLPLLEAVGEAVAVNPDPRLRRAAHSRGWRVLRFKGTTSQADAARAAAISQLKPLE